jgi:hypothetical protein
MGQVRIGIAASHPRVTEKDVEQFDLEAHVRLEAGLIDSLPSDDLEKALKPSSTGQPTAARPGDFDEPPSLWRSIRQFFKN